MKHDKRTISIAFHKSNDEGKKELLRHWAELREMLRKDIARDRWSTSEDVIKEILAE